MLQHWSSRLGYHTVWYVDTNISEKSFAHRASMAADIIPGQLGQKEIKKSIGITWHKLKNLEFILADKFQNLEIKKDVLESCMFPILLCGAQTWWLTGKEKSMLRTGQRTVEWRILQVV
jgi:hypothetical protein